MMKGFFFIHIVIEWTPIHLCSFTLPAPVSFSSVFHPLNLRFVVYLSLQLNFETWDKSRNIYSHAIGCLTPHGFGLNAHFRMQSQSEWQYQQTDAKPLTTFTILSLAHEHANICITLTLCTAEDIEVLLVLQVLDLKTKILIQRHFDMLIFNSIWTTVKKSVSFSPALLLL